MKEKSPKSTGIHKMSENKLLKKARAELNALMSQRLTDTIDLQMQVKQAHWNMKGPSFTGTHELFDKVYKDMESYVNMIAEDIVQLGGIAEGTIHTTAALARIEEYHLTITKDTDPVEVLSKALLLTGMKSATCLIKGKH